MSVSACLLYVHGIVNKKKGKSDHLSAHCVFARFSDVGTLARHSSAGSLAPRVPPALLLSLPLKPDRASFEEH